MIRKPNFVKKHAHQCVAPEFLGPAHRDTDFSFSFNPVTQHFDSKERINRVYTDTFKLLCSQPSISGKLRMEVSSTGRLHFHGTIRILDPKQFYVYTVPILQASGTYEIDTIQNPDEWRTYCEKQESVMGKIVLRFTWQPVVTKPVIPKWFTASGGDEVVKGELLEGSEVGHEDPPGDFF